MRNTDFCMCEIKATDRLCGDHTADQRLCFHYIDSAIFLLPYYKISSLLVLIYGCTAQFVLNLVRNPEDRFSCNEAHLFQVIQTLFCSISFSRDKHHSLQSTLYPWISPFLTPITFEPYMEAISLQFRCRTYSNI